MAGGLAADANAGGDVVADERPRGLRRLDRLSTPVGLGLGMGVGAVLTWGLFAWGPTAGLVGGLLLLGGAAALAYSAEPVWELEEMARPRPEPEPQPTPPGAVAVAPEELLDLVPLSGGEFVMGSSPATDPGHYEDEAPRRRVRVSPFRMARVPVTQAQYREVMGENPGVPQGPELPVNNVRWLDAVRFCNALSERERLASCYEISEDNQVRWRREANGYRLPTEAEWEYAARAGTTTPYPFDEAELDAHAWYEANTGNQVQPVGTKIENPFGLQDPEDEGDKGATDQGWRRPERTQRKPTFLPRTSGPTPFRNAARRTLGTFHAEPPRNTREQAGLSATALSLS